MGLIKPALTSRERILRTYRRQDIDRIAMVDRPWDGTLRRWYQEGLPAGADWIDYFGFDRVIQVHPDNSPRFEKKILGQTDRYQIITTPWGQTEKSFGELDSTPEVLENYYNTSERWEEAKARMLEYHPDRIPWDYLKENYPKWKAEGAFLQLVVWFGFDVTHSHMVGTEDLLIAMIDELNG